MSLAEMPITLPREAAEKRDHTQAVTQAVARPWIESALVALFAAAAVFLASSLAVVIGLV